MTNKEQVIRDFGIEIEEVEPTVYKVINTDKEFNIDKLQWALEQCVVIASSETHYVKEPSGIHTSIGHIYYIVTEYEIDLAYNYFYKARDEFGKVLYLDYEHNPNYVEGIDTIYSKDEV